MFRKNAYIAVVQAGELTYILKGHYANLRIAKREFKNELAKLAGHPKTFLFQARKTEHLESAEKYLKERFKDHRFY